MSDNSEKLAIFLIGFDAFKYLIILFSLYNSLASWQHLINDILFDFLHCFIQAYLDNILIYNKTIKKYDSYVCQFL